MPIIKLDDLEFNAKGYAYHDMKVVSAQITTAKTGSTSLNLGLEDDQGRHAWIDAWLTVNAWGQSEEMLSKVFDYNDGLSALRAGCKEFVGAEVNVVFMEDEYEGKKRARATFLNAPRESSTDEQWNDLMSEHGLDTSAGTGAIPESGTESAVEEGLPF